jgi:hypothetical protein
MLLDRHRRLCRANQIASGEVTEQVARACSIAYSDLIHEAGVGIIPQGIGKPLAQVARWCANRDWPPLHALVVNAETGTPGETYWKSPGTTANRLEDMRRCLTFRDYPEKV